MLNPLDPGFSVLAKQCGGKNCGIPGQNTRKVRTKPSHGQTNWDAKKGKKEKNPQKLGRNQDKSLHKIVNFLASTGCCWLDLELYKFIPRPFQDIAEKKFDVGLSVLLK